MFTLTLHKSDRVFRFPVFTWQLYFCEGTTQITPVAKSSDHQGYTTTWEVLELLALLLPFHLLLHLNPQQMGSPGFQLELGPTYWSVTSLTTVNLSRTETNPKEIVRLFFLVSIFLFLAFNFGPVEFNRDLSSTWNIHSHIHIWMDHNKLY